MFSEEGEYLEGEEGSCSGNVCCDLQCRTKKERIKLTLYLLRVVKIKPNHANYKNRPNIR